MLGKEFYKIDTNIELSNERLKSLVFFYEPLIGTSSLYTYEYMVLNGSSLTFKELNELLSSLNISVDVFEKQCKKLNEYRLLKTLKQDDKYVFVLSNPLTRKEFVKDDVFVRDFILKTSGKHYQEIIADIFDDEQYKNYEDVSYKLSPEVINSWSKEDETYLQKRSVPTYDFNTFFDINVFLKDISTTLLPMRFRTNENMKQIALLADLYNVSYDKMRTFLPKISKSNSNEFDLNKLKYLCMEAHGTYTKVPDNKYDVPCELYLMSLQDGKELTEYDKKIIYNLANEYHLRVDVINVLLKHCLENCDNRLIEKYLYPIASDLHRNNIGNAESALKRLSKDNKMVSKSADKLPTYNDSNNNTISKDEEDEILRLMGKK